MPLLIKLDYWSHSKGIQAPSQIIREEATSDFLVVVSEEVDEGKAFDVKVNPQLTQEQEWSLETLIKLLKPEIGSDAVDAIHILLESVFLAGIKFAEQSQKM